MSLVISGTLRKEAVVPSDPSSAVSAVLSADARALESYLRTECEGRVLARPKWRIRADLAAAGRPVTARNFDQAMEDLALATGDVGSCTDGFYWMVSSEDYDVAYGWLTTRFEAQRTRAERIKARQLQRFPPPGILFDVWGFT